MRYINQSELESFIGPDIFPPKMKISKFPCHTQAVERCVKLVTEASAAVCEKDRDGWIK